jgi:hypothetical protein
METKAFENVKNQVGRCGIWCGSCVVGNGTLKTLAKRCEHIVEGYGVDKWGATDFDGKEFMKGLKSIQALPICQGCLKGDGNNLCRIRPCVLRKKLSDCTECDKMMACENAEALRKVRSGALAVGMMARTENDKADQRQLVEKWIAETLNKCPVCGA